MKATDESKKFGIYVDIAKKRMEDDLFDDFLKFSLWTVFSGGSVGTI